MHKRGEKFKCREIFIPEEIKKENEISGDAIITKQEITFLGGVDAESGKITDKTHELYGRSIAGRIFVFPKSRGSTVGSYVIYGLSRKRKAPSAIVVKNVDNIVLAGAIIAGIPLIKCGDERIFDKKGKAKLIINLRKNYIVAICL